MHYYLSVKIVDAPSIHASLRPTVNSKVVDLYSTATHKPNVPFAMTMDMETSWMRMFPELVPAGVAAKYEPIHSRPRTSWVPNTSDTYCESSFSTQLWLYDGMIIACNAFQAQNSSITNIEGHIITNSFITNTEVQICNLKIHFLWILTHWL